MVLFEDVVHRNRHVPARGNKNASPLFAPGWPPGNDQTILTDARIIEHNRSAYTQMLKDNGITISMSRKGNPWDNAACESLMKTLKHEEVHRTEYRNPADARARIGQFLESIYNDRRLLGNPGQGERDSGMMPNGVPG